MWPTMSVSTVPISIIPTCTTTTGTAIETNARHSDADATRSSAAAIATSEDTVITEISSIRLGKPKGVHKA